MLYVLRATAVHGAIAVLLMTLIGCQAGASLPSPSVNDATVTNDYPAVVEVILPGGTGLCSGTFISANAVLTAAHCALTTGTYTIVTSWGTFTTTNKITYGPGTVTDPNDMAIIYFNSAVANVSQNQIIGVSNQTQSGDTLRLVGFGCDNIIEKTDAGVKRTGTNVLSSIDDYLEFITPAGAWSEKVLGPSNRAGSCFGDSGGPALETLSNGRLNLVGIAHAGGIDTAGNVDSEYVNITSNDNWDFLQTQNTNLNLNIVGM